MNWLCTFTSRSFACVLIIAISTVGVSQESPSNAVGLPASGPLRAGAYAQDISPTAWPVWVDGGFVAVKAERLQDPMHARCLVLDNGQTTLAIAVVDSCSLPVPFITEIRESIERSIGIPKSNIIISATHTHSAPSISGLHSTPAEEGYKTQLRQWIIDGIAEAKKRLQPARVGWRSTKADRYIYCRDWIMKPGTAQTVPFTGVTENQVQMNPGYDNANRVRNFEEIDRQIPILSIQSIDGKPIAVLASFCTHYAGSPAVSADYFGVVCRKLKSELSPNNDQFVGMMANATSGDANCIDFSNPPKPFTHHDVGEYVAGLILESLPSIEYQVDVPLVAYSNVITVDARIPKEEEVVAAKKLRDQRFPDRLPSNVEENYIRETILMSELPPTRDLPLTAMRIGNLAIASNPCETYNVSGLKIRSASPMPLTMNIGLANGYAGYIPPPDRMQLGGYTSWRARSSCLEVNAEPKMVEGLSKLLKKLDASNQIKPPPKLPSTNDTSSSSPRRQALSIEDSLSSFEIDPNNQIRAVAWEPQVVDPIDIDFDDAGRIWVVEMRDYPTGSPDGKPLSRIVILNDFDHDGRFESSRVFADNLLFATGLQLFDGGAIVTVAGEVLFMADRDRDGIAEVKNVLLRGFKAENPQLRANNPTLGPDFRLYIANGLRGGKIEIVGEGTSWRTRGKSIELGTLDFCIDLRSGDYELMTGAAQFGLSFDEYGRRYFCSNRNPCMQAIVEQNNSELNLLDLQIQNTNPLAGIIPSFADVIPSGDQSHVCPIVDAWTTSNLHQGQFTAACGVLVTSTSQLEQSDFGHALVCEPTGSLVHRRKLRFEGARTVVDDEPPKREWLASRDPWFRPVNLTAGPDGSIYVADMHRAVIEHPEWVPSELKNREDTWWGNKNGRIYAIDAKGRELKDSISLFRDLAEKPLRFRPTEELLQMLDHPHSWYRRTAARLLFERHDFRMYDSQDFQQQQGLTKQLATFQHSEGRMLGLKLINFGPRLRFERNKAQFAASVWKNGRDPMKDALDKELPFSMLEHESSVTRHLAALACDDNGGNKDRSIEQLANYAIRERNDPYALLTATGTVLEWRVGRGKLSGEWLESLLNEVRKIDSLEPWFLSSFQALAKRAVEDRSSVWKNILQKMESSLEDQSQRHDEWLAILEGWTQATKKRDEDNGVWDARKQIDSKLATLVSDIALSNQESEAARCSAIRILEAINYAPFADNLKSLVDADSEQIRLSAIRAWRKLAPVAFATWAIDSFDSSGPSTRKALFTTLMQGGSTGKLLVDALESDKVSIRSLDTIQIQSLKNSDFGDVQARASKLVAALSNSNRQAVIDRYLPQLGSSRDANLGKAVFTQHCAACHRLDGVGAPIGPDISDSRTVTHEQLLVSILDPNRQIDNNFFRYRALTHDGQIVEGLLAEESSKSVTLKTQQGDRVTLVRSDLARFESSGVSLMPDGFENQIDTNQMSALVDYLKTWRYAKASIPVGK